MFLVSQLHNFPHFSAFVRLIINEEILTRSQATPVTELPSTEIVDSTPLFYRLKQNLKVFIPLHLFCNQG
jgi:hypothetical protein